MNSFGPGHVGNSPTTWGCTGGCAFSLAHSGLLHNDVCADGVIGDFAALSAANSPTALRATRGWDLIHVRDRSNNDKS
jgi:hypothetical protein